jgi:hypothetical protein
MWTDCIFAVTATVRCNPRHTNQPGGQPKQTAETQSMPLTCSYPPQQVSSESCQESPTVTALNVPLGTPFQTVRLRPLSFKRVVLVSSRLAYALADNSNLHTIFFPQGDSVLGRNSQRNDCPQSQCTLSQMKIRNGNLHLKLHREEFLKVPPITLLLIQ